MKPRYIMYMMQGFHIFIIQVSFQLSYFGADGKSKGEVYRSLTSEEKLHEYLFRDESVDFTIFPKAKGVLDMTFEVYLYGADIETDSETLSLDVNFAQKWKNPRLTWKPEDFGNITTINVDPEKVWVPDIYIHSNIEADKEYNGLLSTLLTRIILNHDGTQIWFAPSTIILKCSLYILNYPFDTQRCRLQFGSFSFDSNRLNIHVKPMNVESYEDPPEWELTSADYSKEYIVYPGSKTPYTDAVYYLTLRRKALAPLKLLVLPNLILIALTFMVFVIPTDAGERIGYLFTTFLAIAFFMTDTIGTLPLSSFHVPLCVTFMGISSISLALLAFCLCYSIGCYYANINLVVLPDIWRKTSEKMAKYCFVNTERKIYDWRKMLKDIREIEINSAHENIKKEENTSTASSGDYAEIEEYKELFDQYFPYFPNQNDMRFLHSKLNLILANFEEEDEARWRRMEWEQFSKVLDRICFVVFTSIFVLSMIMAGIRISLIH